MRARHKKKKNFLAESFMSRTVVKCDKCLEQIFTNVWNKCLEMFGIQTFNISCCTLAYMSKRRTLV